MNISLGFVWGFFAIVITILSPRFAVASDAVNEREKIRELRAKISVLQLQIAHAQPGQLNNLIFEIQRAQRELEEEISAVPTLIRKIQYSLTSLNNDLINIRTSFESLPRRHHAVDSLTHAFILLKADENEFKNIPETNHESTEGLEQLRKIQMGLDQFQNQIIVYLQKQAKKVKNVIGLYQAWDKEKVVIFQERSISDTDEQEQISVLVHSEIELISNQLELEPLGDMRQGTKDLHKIYKEIKSLGKPPYSRTTLKKIHSLYRSALIVSLKTSRLPEYESRCNQGQFGEGCFFVALQTVTGIVGTAIGFGIGGLLATSGNDFSIAKLLIPPAILGLPLHIPIVRVLYRTIEEYVLPRQWSNAAVKALGQGSTASRLCELALIKWQ